MRTSGKAAVLLVSGLAGCTMGARPTTFRPAMSPAGVEARVTLYDDRHAANPLTGELLAVSDSGLIMLATDGRIVHVFWSAVRQSRFRQVGARPGGGTQPDSAEREQLRLVSRFPHGMSPELTRSILESLGKERVEEYRGPAGEAAPLPGASAATPAGDSIFLAQARAGTARYHELDSAIVDGFRRIGGDFPGMGEHWVHTGRLMSGAVDAASPAILTYAAIAGRPTLLGVAYALPLAPGDPLPSVPRAAWHAHAGTVEEASFLPRHAGRAHDAAVPGAGIAVLHAWVWLENPHGPFATDNPALPFARAGLPPSAAPPPALRALALAHGAVPFYTEAIDRSAKLEPGERDAIARLLAGGAARARAAIGERSAGIPRDVLETIWEEVWDGIAAIDRRASAARSLGFALKQP